jgi:hypothetical protein
MFRFIVGIIIVALSGRFVLADQDIPTLRIAHSGRALYTIVVAPDASAVENNAAKALQLYLWKITGSVFELKSDDHPDLSHPLIAVGPSAARMIDPALDLSLQSLGREGIVIHAAGDDLILSGAAGASRGTIYAVYTFLQQLGCRWWSLTEPRIPRIPDLSIPLPQVRFIPPLEYREVYEFTSFNPDWALPNRINASRSGIPPELGGHVIYAGDFFVHTFDRLVPHEKYFAQHPEWFSEINGKRVAPPNPTQLCLTNPQLLEFVKQQVRDIAAKVPPDTDAIISVSQNDNSNPCQCANCLKLEQYEGSPSGPLLHFVNAIADDLRDDYPRIAIDTLAYRYTRKPPAHVRPRDNVIVRLCDIECSFAQPLTDPVNATFAAETRRWSEICKRLYVWDYIVNFAHYVQPHPNLFVLGPNVRFFANNGIKGIFEQGNYHSPGGDFAILRQWVLAQLLWDPSLDDRQLISQFLDEYYEQASSTIAQYIDLRHAAAKDLFVGISDAVDSPWLTPRLLHQSIQLLEKAQLLVADKPEIARRVELLQAPVLHAIVQGWRHRQVMRILNRPWPYDQPKGYYLDRLSRIISDHHITALSEGRSEGDLQAWINSLRDDPAAVAPPPQIANLPRADWYDLQDHDFSIIGQSNGWVSREADPKASDGRAAIMPGNHPQWAIQTRMDGLLADDQPQRPWNIYASVRIKADADPSTIAFTAGVYDNSNSAAASPPVAITLAQIPDGEYHWYKIASIPMSHTKFIWFAPPNNDKIQQIAVDRILFIRADADPGTLIK